MIDIKEDGQAEEDYEFRAAPFAITEECIFIKQEAKENEEKARLVLPRPQRDKRRSEENHHQ